MEATIRRENNWVETSIDSIPTISYKFAEWHIIRLW